MARRAQPYRLSGTVSPRMVEQIDEMFQLLFDDTHNGTMDIRASQLRSGILSVPRGGTGIGEYVIGDILYASDIDVLSTLADVAAGSYLRSGGVGAAPVWSTVTLPNTATIGDLWYASAADTMSALAGVAAGSYLRSGGVATAPVWSSITLPNSAAVGDLWYASTTSAITALASVSAGSYLRSAGVSTAPVWSTVKIPNTATTGDLWYASASNTLSALASVAAGSYLRSAGVTTAPVWSTLVLPNASSQGDLFYSAAANVMTVLAKNASATRYLSNTGASNDPAWAQVNLANGITGNLPFANLPTGSGSWTGVTAITFDENTTLTFGLNTLISGDNIQLGNVDGSLGVVNGGTGLTSVVQGDLLYGSGASVISALAKNTTATRYLSNTGTANSPAWAQINLPDGVTGALPIANLGNGTFTVVASTATGTQNDWAPGIVGNTYVPWSGASDLTVTGLATPANGLIFVFKNTGSNWAYFSHQSGSSTAVNRLVNIVTSDSTPVGPGGMAMWQYRTTDDRWFMLCHHQGSWFTPAYASGDYTGNASMTWTVDSGDVTTDRYMIIGNTVIYQFYYRSTTVGGTPSTDLRRALPTLLTPKTAGEIVATWGRNLDNGTANDGFTYTFGTGGLYLFLRRDKTSGNWAAATNNTSIQGTHFWELT